MNRLGHYSHQLIRLALLLVLLRMAFSPEPAKAQFILSGDFDARLSHLNLRRTVPDSLYNDTWSLFSYGELDMAYLRKKWNAYASVFVTYTKGTSLFSAEAPGSVNAGFYEAWFNYHFSKYFSLQAGRIEISYDDQLFFQARDWSGLVTSHNAVIAHFLIPDTSTLVDLGFAANKFDAGTGIFSTNRTVNNYRYMTYLYAYQRLFDEQLNITFNDIFNADDNGVDKTLLYGRNTLGFSSWLSLDSWDINAAGYYQFGHINDGRRLSAWYYAAYVAWHPTDWLTLMPAFEHMSGDNLSDSAEWKKVVHGFSMLYGNMTRSFGKSGVFNYSYRTNLHPGINNLYFTSVFDILHNLSIEASYHWYSLPYPYIRQFVPDSSKIMVVKVPQSFMHQAELTISWVPVPSLELTLDYQLLFPGKGMMNFNGWNFTTGSAVSSAYIEIEWTPVFLPRKKHKTLKPYSPGSPYG